MSRVFLALLLFAPLAQAASPPKKTLTLAHIKLSGGMAEQAPSTDPLGSVLVETFKAKLDRLKKASKDKAVDAIVLEIDGVSAGWGKVNEITGAIAAARKTGKKVHGVMEGGGLKDYAVALACDDVSLPEQSWLMLTGLRAEVTFYKGLLAKLGVKADFVMMGDFKSAAEPFLRDRLSEPNRKQITEMLDDFFEHEVVGRIVNGRQSRKLTAERVKKIIDEGPYAARTAFKLGLVDRLGDVQDTAEALKTTAKADTLKLIKDYGKKTDDDLDILGLYRKLFFGSSGSLFADKSPKVAVIYATGAITTGKSGGGFLAGDSMGSETMVKAIREAAKDDTVKAIVLRIDSPGGSALGSDLIWKELKRAKKPVIASMSDVAASGGYYIAMSADRIYAEPGTITGSIGVIGGKLATKGLWEKVGITSEVIARGKNSGLFSDEPFTEEQKKAFKAMMEDTYAQFLAKALEGRKKAGKKLTLGQLKELAGGRVWTGRQAKANGLIDELGTLEDAIAYAAKVGKLPSGKEPSLKFLPKPRNFLDSLLGSGLGAKVDLGVLAPELAGKLRGVGVLMELRREPVWAILPFRLDVR